MHWVIFKHHRKIISLNPHIKCKTIKFHSTILLTKNTKFSAPKIEEKVYEASEVIFYSSVRKIQQKFWQFFGEGNNKVYKLFAFA